MCAGHNLTVLVLEVPAAEEEAKRVEFIHQMDERFFAECERELTAINLFFSQKCAEAQGKYHELENELAQYKVHLLFYLAHHE